MDFANFGDRISSHEAVVAAREALKRRITQPLAETLARVSNRLIVDASGYEFSPHCVGYLGFTSVPDLKTGLEIARTQVEALGITPEQTILGVDLDGVLEMNGGHHNREGLLTLLYSEFGQNLILKTNRREGLPLNSMAELGIKRHGSKLSLDAYPLNSWIADMGLADRTFWGMDQQNPLNVPGLRNQEQWQKMISHLAQKQPRLFVDISDQGLVWPPSVLQDFTWANLSQANFPRKIQEELAAQNIQPPFTSNIAVNPSVGRVISTKP